MPSVSRLDAEIVKAASKREQCHARMSNAGPMEQREPKGCSHPLGRVATEEGESQREQARRRKRQWGLLRPLPQIDN